MKGPGNRVRHDVRRVWQCPACGRREKTGGQVVCLRCNCGTAGTATDPPWMQLIEDRPAKPGAGGKVEAEGLGQQPQ
jgi:hypothetical protein